MPGIDKIATITIAVKDQEEALTWFTEKLGFVKRMDRQGPGMRWLTISPKNQTEVEFLLAGGVSRPLGKNPHCVVGPQGSSPPFAQVKGARWEVHATPPDRPHGAGAGFNALR